MPSYQYVQIGFEPDTIDELDEIANMKDISRGELVRRMVDSELDLWMSLSYKQKRENITIV